MKVKRCGWLWQKFAVYEEFVDEPASGWCGGSLDYRRVTARYAQRVTAEMAMYALEQYSAERERVWR